MTETTEHESTRPLDRKLGDEWHDWKGGTDPGNAEINEKVTTFSILACCMALIAVSLFEFGWYLTKPRIHQLSPVLSVAMEWMAIIGGILFLLLCCLEIVWLLKLRRSLFPYVLIEKLLLSILPRTIWLGGKVGINRDRVANSFIKMHNLLVRSHAGRVNPEMLLVLLPRCLQKEARSAILKRIDKDTVKIYTAGGGEEARKAIEKYRPSLILAIACERDLISGIKDVAARIPVFAVPNKRPEGPCKNTHLAAEDLEEALRFITTGKGESRSPAS